MKTITLSALGFLIALAQPLCAEPATQTERSAVITPGTAEAKRTRKGTATVVGIDAATRTVTLTHLGGKILNVKAGSEVSNFDQIKVGDRVTAEYTQAISLDPRKGAAGMRERAEHSNASRAHPGVRPSGAIGQEVTILADVVAVGDKTKSITLRGPYGNLVDLKVVDPSQLKNIRKGDQVAAVYTEALAVAVEPTPSTSGK